MAYQHPTKDAKGKFLPKALGDKERRQVTTICERIAEGETLTHICQGKGWPSPSTFRNWILKHENLREAYSLARELKSHSLFDEALDMARTIRDTPGNAQRVRAFDVAMNHLRWSAGKLNPGMYSEKATAATLVPIQINTTIDLGGATKTDRAVYEIEAKVEEPENVITESTKPERPPRGRKRLSSPDGEAGAESA